MTNEEAFRKWRTDYESDYDKKPSYLEVWQAAIAYMQEKSKEVVEAIRERDRLGFAVVNVIGKLDEIIENTQEIEIDDFLHIAVPIDMWNELESSLEDMPNRADLYTTPQRQQPLKRLSLEDKEREIAELKTTVRSDNSKVIAALNANNNDLREALEYWSKVINYQYSGSKEAMSFLQQADELAEQALSKTPAQSLQSVINETIEECAKVCEEIVIENPGRADLTVDQCAKTIRALKGKQND